ncbi:uncharacterized protein isoform X2 [Choristoneura fumiferana]|uniref:uncharacterized protein isoform X2 n=1 Tax=Choristoneura fumiferana TaxID=7141 RepID=UPI003D15707C
MSRKNVFFYICIIVMNLVTIVVRANENIAIYHAPKAVQSTWNRPCYLYGQRIDCSVLRNSYIIPIYPTTRFDARLFTPRNTFTVPLTTVLHYDVELNKFENPQNVPFQYKYQPRQIISESAPPKFNIYKSSPPLTATTSSEIGNLLKIKNTMTLSEFKQTTNTVNINRYPPTATTSSEIDNLLKFKNTMTLSDFKQTTNSVKINRYPPTATTSSEIDNLLKFKNTMTLSDFKQTTNSVKINRYPPTATSSKIDNLLKIKNTMTLSDFKQTTNSVKINRYPFTEPAVTSLKATATSSAENVTAEYNEMLTKTDVSTTEHQNGNFVQYSSTTSKNISISNDILTRKIFFLPGSGLTRNEILFLKFKKTLDRLERKFFLSAFTKLTAISPEDRRENGISFLQSGLFLHLLLVTLSTDMDKNVTQEIEECMGLNMTEADKIDMIRLVVSWLPESSDVLKFRWTSRLVLGHATQASREFQEGAAAALPLRLSWLNGSETSAEITKSLNEMVEADSGGAMHNTFEEEELSSGVCGVALGTLYMRGRWRAAPTLLNDSLLFRDAEPAPSRYTRLFRINDIVGYAYLHEWDAEAIEISYATPGLTLLMLVPKEPSLRKLVEKVTSVGLESVLAVMHQLRAAVTLPLYTLRMTLLLPNKLEDMGMPSLLSTNETDCNTLKFSHAVQRLMFWAEAGRNAFKDDGIEWDPRPEMEIVVDRPYLFFVRWHNITLMNGNFVL